MGFLPFRRSPSASLSVTRLSLLYLFFQLTLIPGISGGFNKITCWYSLCIQQNAQGTWCYVPQAGDTRETTCKGSSADFATVLDVHLQQGLSIAYYNGAGNEFLGGSNYSLSANPGVIRLCVSGRAGDGNYETLCVNANQDNVLAGSPYCQVALPQRNVTDGCYDPQARLPSSSTSTLSSLSSSSTGGISPGYCNRSHATVTIPNIHIAFAATAVFYISSALTSRML